MKSTEKTMRVVNGKWQDDKGDPIDHFNISKFLEIGKKVKAVYGNNITSNRIELISSLGNLSENEEKGLTHLLNSEVNISKLAGL
jgi:hypothetical protein